MSIVLIGMMGSGKTTVGQLVAEQLGWEFFDLDDAVVRATGRSVGEIFAAEGEAGFRSHELYCARALVAKKNIVLAAGGGAVTLPETLGVLREIGTTIYLRASVEAILGRLPPAEIEQRPLIAESPVNSLSALLEERERLYESADVTVPTDGQTPECIAAFIVQIAEATR